MQGSTVLLSYDSGMVEPCTLFLSYDLVIKIEERREFRWTVMVTVDNHFDSMTEYSLRSLSYRAFIEESPMK